MLRFNKAQREVKKIKATLVSIADISALAMGSATLPYHFAYATRVSG
jgi:hypothetical protein